MADTAGKQDEKDKPEPQDRHDEASLKGTFVSVMILGGFLALTWLLVFILFIARS